MGGLASGREAVIRNKIVSLTHIWNLKKTVLMNLVAGQE